MQIRLPSPGGRIRRVVPALALAAAGLAVFHRPIFQASGLALGGAALAFCLSPAADCFERRLSRPAAALAAVGAACAALLLTAALLLPAVVRELQQVVEALPLAVGRLAQWGDGLSAWAASRLPGARLPSLPAERIADALAGVATGAVALLGGLADGASKLSMMLILSYFFLRDRDRLLLRLELLAPLAVRPAAVRAGRAVLRELRLYLKGQLLVAGAVGALSAAGLALAGVRSALVLGGVVGLMNMVPYFGPAIGGAPAVLIALSDGPGRAALCAGVLGLVQQIDAALLSPRVMGSLSGFSPAAVLLAIYAGGAFAGIGGMLAALPALMAIRTVFRVFVQNRENI